MDSTRPQLSQGSVRRLRQLSAAMGAALIGLAIFADGPRPSLSTFGELQVAVALIGGALVACAALGPRWVPAFRGLAVASLSALIVLAVFEVAAGVVLSRLPPADARWDSLAYYRSQPWFPSFLVEHRATIRVDYQPFTLWRTRDAAGEHVNVEQRYRRSLHDREPCATKVFVFGGSAAWGYGSPDWGTIPSYLGELMRAEGVDVCVLNRAELAYVTSQEVIALEAELRAGNEPDVVIFYHGFNDVTASWEAGRAGTHRGADLVADLFETGRGRPLADWFATSNLRTIATRFPPQERFFPNRSQSDRLEIAQATTRVYFANLRAAQALAREYDFEVAFFWQPHIRAGSKPLTASERAIHDSPGVSAAADLLRLVDSLVATQAEVRGSPTMLLEIFDEIDEEMWIDDVHVNPEANRIVAERIAEQLRQRGVAQGAR